MYAKCGSLEDAWGVFNTMPTRDVVAWNAMILGYVKCGQGKKALKMFGRMQWEGVDLSPVTCLGVLNACASVGALEEGRCVHAQIIDKGFEDDISVASCLLDMYAKCGSIEDAWRVFQKMPRHDVISSTAMIAGFVKCGKGKKALDLYRQMELEGMEPNPVTFAGVLNACASVMALGEGRRVHEQIMQSGCESDVFVSSCLVDMYAKCGSIEDASKIFNKMSARDVVSWTTMLGGYAMHGFAKEALELFEQICQEGIDVNRVTFVCLLSACSHAGLVDEGLHYLESMTAVYDILPTVEHFACVIDLLGRAGRLHEAEDLIKKIPFEQSASVWMSLLGASRVHGNLRMGEKVARRVLELDPKSPAGYVQLANLYADARKWESKADVRQVMLEKGVKKEPGRTWIEVKNEMHSFTADDRSHPQIIEIREELEKLFRQMKEAGYVPDIKFVLRHVDDGEGEVLLNHHSEKLAIAYGLISTPSGTPLRIFKNLRVCSDCHTATKIRGIIFSAGIIGDVS